MVVRFAVVVAPSILFDLASQIEPLLHLAFGKMIPTAGIIDLCEPTLSIRWT